MSRSPEPRQTDRGKAAQARPPREAEGPSGRLVAGVRPGAGGAGAQAGLGPRGLVCLLRVNSLQAWTAANSTLLWLRISILERKHHRQV